MVPPMGAIWMAGGVPHPSPGPLVPSACGGGNGGEGGGVSTLHNSLSHRFYDRQSVITDTMGKMG